MNTRLQVEHPVTEEITGVDLVEWQLRVASGEPIPLKQDELSINGHAIEARLYAEDPAKGFLPSTGRLDSLSLDDRWARIETGVEEADAVTPFYDPMIAKVIVHESDRGEAISTLKRSLSYSFVAPVRTNKGFLFECLDHSDFGAANLDTGLIAKAGEALISPEKPNQAAADTAAQRYLNDRFDWGGYDPLLDGLLGFRLNGSKRESLMLWSGGEAFEALPQRRRNLANTFNTFPSPEDGIIVTDRGQDYTFSPDAPRSRAGASAADGAILAPMPGKVIALDVADGDQVSAGQRLMVLEAMKMEHALTAPFDGTVTGLEASTGGQVQVEAVLCVVEPVEE